MTTAETDQFLAVATHIGERMLRSRVRADGMATWMGDDLEGTAEEPVLIHRAFGSGLYDGTAGIGRFFTDLYAVTEDERFVEPAVEAFRHALHHTDPERVGDGLFDGRLGVALVVLTRAAQLEQSELVDRAADLARDIAAGRRFGDRHDYVGGMAGGIAGLVAVEDVLGTGEFLAAAQELAALVVDDGDRSPTGIAWEQEEDREWGQHMAVNGLAHGVSGVSHALLELDRLDPGGGHGEDTWADVAEAGFRWERQWFARERNGWRDLRMCDPGTAAEAPVSDQWCQGTVGTGLVRLRAGELLGDDRLLAEAGAAMQRAVIVADRMVRAPRDPIPSFDKNASLCHGWGGLCELLCEGARAFGNEDLLDAARRLGAHGAALAQANGRRWNCGLQSAGETPGLLLGLAGIGTTFLRLLGDPRVPPVGLPTMV